VFTRLKMSHQEGEIQVVQPQIWLM